MDGGVLLEESNVDNECVSPVIKVHQQEKVTENVNIRNEKGVDEDFSFLNVEDAGGVSENNDEKNEKIEVRDENLYKTLVTLHEEHLVLYPFSFECPVCFDIYNPYEGIILKECLHIFCRDCLTNSIKLSDSVEIKCPYQDSEYTCPSLLLEHEIQTLLTPEEYEDRLKKTLSHAEANIPHTFHCQRPDCRGWFVNEDGLSEFVCPVCATVNCLQCRAVHTGISCSQYAEAMSLRSGSVDVLKSQRVLNEMVRLGTAMYCPQCTAVVAKEMGCDALTCTVCRTELCWATKGRRWGPGGKGDISGGCMCNVNGKKCHFSCNNCH